MKQKKNHNVGRHFLSFVMALMMVVSLLPSMAFADTTDDSAAVDAGNATIAESAADETPDESQADPVPTEEAASEEPEESTQDVPDSEAINTVGLYDADDAAVTSDNGDSDEMIRIFHLDCGRKYFSLAQIEAIIDTLAENHYTHIELAVGNDALRFLLDDMSVTVGETTYTSDQVKTGIEAGNKAYYNAGDVNELTEAEMDSLISYATGKGISVIPLINTPGHMDSIIDCMEYLGMSGVAYNNSARTIDVTNSTAVAFTQALVQKYVTYFAGKGCTYFNLGADEYANDVYGSGSMGFGQLINTGAYGSFVTYVNGIAEIIKNAGMTPMAFNDGIYFNSKTNYGTFDTSIVICYWSSGWSGYTLATASFLANKGHKIINTNDAWYYVLGRSSETYGYNSALNGATSTKYSDVPGTGDPDVVGCMQCFWCDTPSASYDDSEASNVQTLISTFATNNSDVFKGAENTKSSFSISGLTGETLQVGQLVTLRAGEKATWTTSDANVLQLSSADTEGEIALAAETDTVDATAVTATAVGSGTVSISAVSDADSTKTASINLTVLASDATDAGTTENITVKEGETTSVKVADGDVADELVIDKTGLDENIASVDAYVVTQKNAEKETVSSSKTSYKDVLISDGTNYLVVSSSGKVSSTQNLEEASSFTVTYSSSGYSIQCGEYYLSGGSGSLTASSSEAYWKYSESKGFYVEISYWGYYSTSYYLVYSSGWTISSRSSSNYGALYSVVSSDETYVSFKGNYEGKTSVKIGDVTYNITVTAEDKEMSSSVTLEYWITNIYAYNSKDTTADHSVSIASTDDGVATENGIEINTKASTEKYADFDGWKTVYYWKTVCLDSDHKQTKDGEVDQTHYGTELLGIRYYNNCWEYKLSSGGWRHLKTTDQLVAYYLQKTEVTKEITTYVKDWGYGTDAQTPDSSGKKGQVALTVAVVYPDGTISPTEDDMYSNSTTIYNYWTDRDFGIIRAANNEDYKVSKITVTDGSRTKSTKEYVWTTSDTITWNKTTTASGDTWYDETEVWNKSMGGDPVVNGKDESIGKSVRTWSAKDTAKLILIYLEPVTKETNLNVVYWDDNAKKQINSEDIQVVVKDGTTYTNALMNGTDELIGGTTSWTGKTSTEENYFPDNAYVVNAAGNKRTFNKNLGTVTSAEAIYQSGLYEYVRADISEDGKTLTFHYNLKTTDNNKTFVVDFGLPLEVLPTEFGITDPTTIESISLFEGKIIHENTGNYGTAKISEDGTYKVTYTLTKTLDASAVISLYVKFTGSTDAQLFSITVIPASNVYYEDSFVKTSDGAGVVVGATWQESTDESKKSETPTQALEELGAEGNNAYGYDPAYSSSTKYSMGSAKQITVTKAQASETWTDESAWPTAEFEFKGTGFDIISLTDNNSGAIVVNVERTDTDTSGYTEYNKNFLVNNYYGYRYNEENETWEVDTTSTDNALYQIPVMKVTGLDYGKYKVTITISYGEFFDKTGDAQYSFWLDGVRVYDPMGTDYAGYVRDKEGYPQYLELRNALVSKQAQATSDVLFIDGAAEAKIADYSNYGPNHEVYLSKGQAITFTLANASDDDDALAQIDSVQVGAKTPNGSDTSSAVMNLGSVESATTISTATEMYYDMTAVAITDGTANQVTITNTGDAILSLTNLKITYKKNDCSVGFGSLTQAQQTNAVNAIRLLYSAPVEAETEVFTPETFEASWKSSSVTAGKQATLTIKTSQDVEAVVVNGETIDTYRTRTQRKSLFGAKTTYREFTYSVTASETTDYSITAVNSEGVASEAITTTLTVKSSQGSWWQRFLSLWS